MSSAVKLVFSILALLVFTVGCGESSSTQVLSGKVADDPSLGPGYTGETVATLWQQSQRKLQKPSSRKIAMHEFL